MESSKSAKGESVRRYVLGDGYVDKALSNATDFTRPFQHILNEYCWGECWTDESLSFRDRSLLNLGMLASLNRMHEFRIHFRGAINNGLSESELRAALTQIAVYAGIPAGVECFRIAKDVFEEIDEGAAK